MLWHRSWVETRWRFLIGLVVLMCSAAGVVSQWPRVVELLPLASNLQVNGTIGRIIRESVDLQREYPGYIWSQWFRQNLTMFGTLLAALLGTGGLLSQRSAAMFMLSLPVSRKRVIGTRAATGLAELFVLALAPSLLIPLLSPTVGKAYAVGDAAVHGVCFFFAVAVFFSLALLLSTVFHDLWRPLLMALAAAMLLGIFEQVALPESSYGIFRVMSAEAWFRNGQVPWLGLLASAAASIAMLYGAVANIVRRDF
jgi:ABC-type transport system involved in multi-copper enzyme maturation permease subunit